MFDFLTKLSHQHSPKNIPKQQSAAEQQNIHKEISNNNQQSRVNKQVQKKSPKKKLLSLSAQLQAGQTAALPQQILQILQKIKEQSYTRFNQITGNMIQEQKAAVQRKVYLRQMSNNNQQYLEEILIQSSSDNIFTRNGLSEIVDIVAESVYEDILTTNKYNVHKRIGVNKEDLNLVMNSLNHIKDKQGNIRNKVGQLTLQMKQQAKRIDERSLQIVNKNAYSSNNPKNREVQVFLKNIQTERAQQRMHYQQQLRKQKQRKKRNQYMKELMKEKALSQRHERLAEAYEIKRKIKQEEIAASRQRDMEFKQFLKTYKKKKPLYIQKEEQFVENFVFKQQEQIFNKILQRKQKYAPMSFQDLEDHQDRYEDYKRKKNKFKKAQNKLLKEAQKKRIQDLDQLHKGKFRYYVLQELVQKKQKQRKNLQKQKIIANKIRQKAYSMNIKEYHKPTIDPAKRMQLQSLIAPTNKNGNRYKNPIRMRVNSSQDGSDMYYSIDHDQSHSIAVEKDARKQGERNRRFLKQYIRDKVDRGEIKKKQDEKNRSSTVQQHPNYLQELRNNRKSTAIKFESIDHEIEQIKEKQDIRNLKSKVEQYDEKARRLQEKFKYLAHKPEQQAELQNDYLYSIKAKLQLLNNFD